jgi:Rieske 2Fe-2S family protein
LDGRLAGAPRFGDVPGFRKDHYPLVSLPVSEWRGWVFVNVTGDAPRFEEWVGNLDEIVAPWRPERLRPAARHEYLVQANWKTITENYHECYHCPSIHPELCRVTPPDSGANLTHTGVWIGGSMELRDHADTMSVSGHSAGVRIPGLTDEQARQVLYMGLLPNLLISLHPDYVLTHRLEPVSTTETRVECEWLFPPEALDRPGFDPSYAVEFWDLTNRQDWAAVESVARGLASRGARPGPFAWTEDEVKLFMETIARGYLQGALEPPGRSADGSAPGAGVAG